MLVGWHSFDAMKYMNGDNINICENSNMMNTSDKPFSPDLDKCVGKCIDQHLRNAKASRTNHELQNIWWNPIYYFLALRDVAASDRTTQKRLFVILYFQHRWSLSMVRINMECT